MAARRITPIEPCRHRVCRKLAGCAFRPTPIALPIRTGCCPVCGVWLQNGEAAHRAVVHPEQV